MLRYNFAIAYIPSIFIAQQFIYIESTTSQKSIYIYIYRKIAAERRIAGFGIMQSERGAAKLRYRRCPSSSED